MKKKLVVYTVLTGGYDDIQQPLVVDSRFDYVLFSNDFREDTIGIWHVRSIPQPDGVTTNDNKRISRFPKTHPETMLAEYEASLYIDANIQIADQWVYDRVIKLYEQQIEYAGIKLLATGRDCVYRHSFDMCAMGFENDVNAIQQMNVLYEKGFPEHFGLTENGIIFRIHTKQMKNVDELWWEWILNYSFRDQFSYIYCLWKHDIPINYFLPEGEDVRNTKHFRITYHDNIPSVAKKKLVKVGLMEGIRNFCRKRSKHQYGYHSEIWVKICKMNHSVFWLHVFGICSFVINILLYIPIQILLEIRKRQKSRNK